MPVHSGQGNERKIVDTSEIRDFRVNNEDRELRFRGKFLGFTSTENRGSDRWIEFAIYRTEGGKYVLSRAGRSIRFHVRNCSTVAKNPHLRPASLATMTDESSPCPECMPRGDYHLDDNEQVYPEQDRTWAGVFDTPQSLIDDGLSKRENGVSFLTTVARQVLEKAAENDRDLYDAYYVVEVD